MDEILTKAAQEAPANGWGAFTAALAGVLGLLAKIYFDKRKLDREDRIATAEAEAKLRIARQDATKEDIQFDNKEWEALYRKMERRYEQREKRMEDKMKCYEEENVRLRDHEQSCLRKTAVLEARVEWMERELHAMLQFQEENGLRRPSGLCRIPWIPEDGDRRDHDKDKDARYRGPFDRKDDPEGLKSSKAVPTVPKDPK